MRKVIMILMAVALVALPAIAQNYGKPYSGAPEQNATAPAATFQSTSPYSDQWAESSQQTMINNDGSVNESAYGGSSKAGRPGSIRRDTPGTPGTPGSNPEIQQPLGDALWPLLLCAAAFCGVIALRRKRSALKN